MSRRQSTFLVVGCSFPLDPGNTGPTRTDIHATVHLLASERRGQIVETTSRDLVAAFPSPADALTCALALQQQLDGDSSPAAVSGWDRRLGLDAARAETEAAYDAAIAEARRLRETAEPGGIRISPLVYEAARTGLGLEWDRTPPGACDRCLPEPEPLLCSVTARTQVDAPSTPFPTPAQRTQTLLAAIVAVGLATTCTAGLVYFTAPPAYRDARQGRWEPITIGVTDARIGGIGIQPSVLHQDRTRILVLAGATNHTDREVALRRQDFSLEIGGREVAALPPLGWNTGFSDPTLRWIAGTAAADSAYRFERQHLLPGGSAIVGLQFDYPLDMLEQGGYAVHSHSHPPPFARWTTRMVVERLGAAAPGLHYRGAAGRLRVDLCTDPFRGTIPVGQPSSRCADVAVYRTTQPVHLFNADRLWRFAAQEAARQSRPIVMDLRRWPAPEGAVRAFLQRRVERSGRTPITFVAGPTGADIPAVSSHRGRPGMPRVWFWREADAVAELVERTAAGR